MINTQLIRPDAIAVIGASNDVKKPGGKVFVNLNDGHFRGQLYPVNSKEEVVQGLPCLPSVDDLPQVDLAVIAIPAAQCKAVIQKLADKKQTRAFIILSAGFGEAGEQGKKLEEEIVEIVNKVDGCLIGPNCIGVLNDNYHGIFTTPVPKLDQNGCDLISGSGATAVFIMEAGILLGVKFANVYSVGNSAQIGVEEVLEYMDLHFDADKDPLVKLLYLEAIRNPQKLLKHASSLVRKGAKIAAIKAGSTSAGSRAAASHTGAIASSDVTVRALFKKAGIVYCSSREELLSVASIYHYKALKGPNLAIITHAGGSAVMLTDALSAGGLNIPPLNGAFADKLLTYLHPGSSVHNPIDFLATGTAEQLGVIIDFCEHKFDEIEGMVVVFGSPGLFDVEHVYNVISAKLEVCKKPIYPVLPSLINAQKEIQGFLAKGHVNFPDEVVLGRALPEVYKTPYPADEKPDLPELDARAIRKIIDSCDAGFMPPQKVIQLLDAAGIPRVPECLATSAEELLAGAAEIGFPLVMKVVGPVHKTEVSGVVLNIVTEEGLLKHFNKLMQIEGAQKVLIQPMIKGLELFVGAKKEGDFGALVLCGLGGIFIELINDVSAGLAPLSMQESLKMIHNLKGKPLLEGFRGSTPLNVEAFAKTIQRISALALLAPEIAEMDINPLIGNANGLFAVDTRVLLNC